MEYQTCSIISPFSASEIDWHLSVCKRNAELYICKWQNGSHYSLPAFRDFFADTAQYGKKARSPEEV